mmetsp:Transcript_78353/g.151323  ORF Transcript_78353/g.151323 Transcript_78353/m.151323 type:complete len:251 (-) Transcript_78353:85-837(-)
MTTAFGNGFDIPAACLLVVAVVVFVVVGGGVVGTVIVVVIVDVVNDVVVENIEIVDFSSVLNSFLLSPSENSADTKMPLSSTSRALNAYMPCSSVSGGMKDFTPLQNFFRFTGFESNAAVKSLSLESSAAKASGAVLYTRSMRSLNSAMETGARTTALWPLLASTAVPFILARKKPPVCNPSRNSSTTSWPLPSASRPRKANVACSSLSGGRKDLVPRTKAARDRGASSSAASSVALLASSAAKASLADE